LVLTKDIHIQNITSKKIGTPTAIIRKCTNVPTW